MKIVIKQGDMSGLKTALSGIKNGTERVLAQAINKTVKTMKTQTRVRIGNELNLKASRISENLSDEKASFKHLSGAVIAKGRPVGLVNFGAKQTKKGVKVKVKRAERMALLRHAFIADGRRGKNPGDGNNRHVFWRTYSGKRRPFNPNINYGALPKLFRLPLEAKYGPRIEDIFASDKVLNPIQTQAAHIFTLNVDKGIMDILRRFG